jgi:hypothetical protein
VTAGPQPSRAIQYKYPLCSKEVNDTIMTGIEEEVMADVVDAQKQFQIKFMSSAKCIVGPVL